MTQTDGHSLTYTRSDWTDFAHTGPGTLAGRYLRLFWHPVFRARDLKPGKAMPIRVMSEDLTVYRGETGTSHTLAFRCAHRGTQLSTGWIEGDNLRCRCHGWAYDGAGQCVEQPAEPEPFCEKVWVRSYPTHEYQGLIFIYMGDGEAPVFPRFPEVEGEGEIRAGLGYRCCNCFSNIENSVDEVHSSFTHRMMWDGGFTRDVPQVWGEETEYGILRHGKRPNGQERLAHFHMPNIHHLGESPEQQSIHWRVPVDDENHMIPTITLVKGQSSGQGRQWTDEDPFESSARVAEIGDQVLAGRFTIEEIEDRRQIIAIQDHVTQIGQGVIADRSTERLGRSDSVIVLLRQLWERELRALAEGRPLTNWTHPEAAILSQDPNPIRTSY